MRLFESPDPPPSGPTAEHRTDAHPGPASETWSVGEFHAAVRSALARRFRGRVWVHGELRARTRNARSGHCYLTLADPHGGRRGGEATLDVVFWSDRWDDVASRLEAAGVVLEEGAELRLRGEVTTWDQGRVMLVADRLDVEGLVGRLAAARARLVRALVAEGLWDRNRDRPAPVLPLRVGLVAAPASDGYHDFVRRLLDSGYAFVVTVAAATVQGTGAPRAVAGALRRLAEHHRSDPLDVVVLVRGGGSRADLAAFDHEDVARAVAGCPVPVWTGIGHSSDTCLADELAHCTLATPTAAAAALVSDVAAAHDRVGERARDLVSGTAGRLRESALAVAAAGAAVSSHGHRTLDRAGAHVLFDARRVERAAVDALDDGLRRALRRGADAASAARRTLDLAATEVAGRRTVATALDPRRVLERGYTLTRRADGTLVRSAAGAEPGEVLITELADGRIRSRVEPPAPDPIP